MATNVKEEKVLKFSPMFNRPGNVENKMDYFERNYLIEAFKAKVINAGLLLMAYHSHKWYGTQIDDVFFENILLYQSPKKILKVYSANVDELRINGNSQHSGPSIVRSLTNRIFWINDDGTSVRLFDNNEWLCKSLVLEKLDYVGRQYGFQCSAKDLSLKRIYLQDAGEA